MDENENQQANQDKVFEVNEYYNLAPLDNPLQGKPPKFVFRPSTSYASVIFIGIFFFLWSLLTGNGWFILLFGLFALAAILWFAFSQPVKRMVISQDKIEIESELTKIELDKSLPKFYSQTFNAQGWVVWLYSNHRIYFFTASPELKKELETLNLVNLNKYFYVAVLVALMILGYMLAARYLM